MKSVRITNIKSYLHAANISVQCEDLGALWVDVAYGGNFYAIVDLQENYKGPGTLSGEPAHYVEPRTS